MVYPITGEVLRQYRERKTMLNGMFTTTQAGVGMISFLAFVVVWQISFWLLIPLAVAVVAAFFGAAPHHGGYLYDEWLAPVRVALFPRRVETSWRAFAELGAPPLEAVPFVWHGADGAMQMSAVAYTTGS